MERLDSYKVNLRDMTTDTVSYEWHAEEDFFSAIQGPEIQHGRIDVALRVKRTSGAYELTFELDGTVEVPCDRCLEPMDQPIHATHTLRVALGERYEDDGELITIPEDDGALSVAWHIYEMAALEIPLRHVHAEGQCTELAETTWSTAEGKESDKEEEIDPRWSALKKLIDNNK